MEQRTEQPKEGYIRWIAIVVPLSALVLIVGVCFIAAEVLTRIV